MYTSLFGALSHIDTLDCVDTRHKNPNANPTETAGINFFAQCTITNGMAHILKSKIMRNKILETIPFSRCINVSGAPNNNTKNSDSNDTSIDIVRYDIIFIK